MKKKTLAMIVIVAFLFLFGITSQKFTFAFTNQTDHSDMTKNSDISLQEKKESAEDQDKAKEKIKAPKIIVKIPPVYPDEAKKKKLEGIVILKIQIDKKGKVTEVKVIKGDHELLNKASIEAIKQWEYEPFIEDGSPKPHQFDVQVHFKLRPEITITPATPPILPKPKEVPALEPIPDVPEIPEGKSPKLIIQVAPVYPEEARAELLQDNVTLEAVIDEKGNVTHAQVIRGIYDSLNLAAIEAVKQWKYEPFIVDGAPRKVKFEITVRFILE
jgi:TonB family protein